MCSIPHEEILPQNVFTMPSFCTLKGSSVKSHLMSNFLTILYKSIPTKGMIDRARLHNALTKCDR